MNEKEVEALEAAIQEIDRAIGELRTEVTQIQLCISRLENLKAFLTRQLPTEKRFNHLFD